MSEAAVTVVDTPSPGYTQDIEVYVDIPAHDCLGSYGQKLRAVEAFGWCARYRFALARGYLGAYSAALAMAFEEDDVVQALNAAQRGTICVQGKHGGPYWKIDIADD